MTATDVITIERAKDWLSIDQSYALDDFKVVEAIEAAVSYVEKYTSHMLYEREEVFYSDGCPITTYAYPINSVIAEDKDGNPAVFKRVNMGGRTTLSTQEGNTLNVSVGYDDMYLIPGSIISAIKKLIVYIIENRSMYGIENDNDVNMLLNLFRRSYP